MRGKLLYLASALGLAVIALSVGLGLAADPWTGPDDEPEPAASDDHDHAHDHGPQPAAEANASPEDPAPAPQLGAHQPRHDHALSDREGEVPSRADASELPHHFEEFVVRGDDGLAEMADRGYVEGSGTLEDPYVIDGFRVDEDLTIADTSRPLVIENSYVEGQLTLNFAGEQVYVHHNYVEDLRVNENVDREGPTTAGLFEHNEIAYIGQLRHFGGTFQHNDVGPRPDGVAETYLSDTGPADVPENLVWNFDGYHGAHVHNNTVEGRVDVKLHGHFHGSCLACSPHAHHLEEDFPGEDDGAEQPRSRHSYRYHVLDFENNTIEAPEADQALRFHDRAHAGDDQTAASEPNPYLEDRHEHHAYLRVHENTVRDGRLVFDVVNAENDRHAGLVQEARIDLADNELERERPRSDSSALVTGYVVYDADTAQLHARDNAYEFLPESSSAPEGYGWAVDGELADAAGFHLHDVNASEVDVAGTQGANATYGLLLDDVRDNTPVETWDNRFDAEEARHER
jgi:hypothetical protein